MRTPSVHRLCPAARAQHVGREAGSPWRTVAEFAPDSPASTSPSSLHGQRLFSSPPLCHRVSSSLAFPTWLNSIKNGLGYSSKAACGWTKWLQAQDKCFVWWGNGPLLHFGLLLGESLEGTLRDLSTDEVRRFEGATVIALRTFGQWSCFRHECIWLSAGEELSAGGKDDGDDEGGDMTHMYQACRCKLMYSFQKLSSYHYGYAEMGSQRGLKIHPHSLEASIFLSLL